MRNFAIEMDNKLILLIIASALVLGACNNSSSSQYPEVDLVEIQLTDNYEHTAANIYIEGMMCQQACVGKVKKELKELACVTEVTIDFEEDRLQDIARVDYDPAQCGAVNLINQIQAIGDGLYQVKKVEVVKYVLSSEL